MEAKHTPGPWEAHKGTEDEPDRWCVLVDGPQPWLVATIENGAPGDTLKTEEANARLFAAAPELLAAIKSLVGRDLTFLDSKVMGDQITYASVKAARAAIAKAEDI